MLKNKFSNYLKLNQRNFKFIFAAFSKYEPTTAKEKLYEVTKKMYEESKDHQDEIKFLEKKVNPFFNKIRIIRSPIYISMLPLIWSNPFTLSYSVLILSANFYLIFLTTLEATTLFSMGLNQYGLLNINTKEEKEGIILKSRSTFKRLLMMVLFYSFLILSGVLASNFQNRESLILLFGLNLYIAIKIAYHITLYGLNKRLFEKRIKNSAMNLCIIILIGVIHYKKKKIIQDNSYVY
jgi:hypothetical protein